MIWTPDDDDEEEEEEEEDKEEENRDDTCEQLVNDNDPARLIFLYY